VAVRRRTRLPRLLFSVEGIIRPWHAGLDAEVLWSLGAAYTNGAQIVLSLDFANQRHTALLLFPKYLVLAPNMIVGKVKS